MNNKKDDYDYAQYVANKSVTVTPICIMRYPPHYHCTAQDADEQSECMYFKADSDGNCDFSSGQDYVYCNRMTK